MLLQCQDLTVCHQDKKLLNNISFDLAVDQTLAIMGPSGSGKTTLMWSILKLLPSYFQFYGTILYDGQPVTKKNIKELRLHEWSFISQNPWQNFAPWLTISEHMQQLLQQRFGWKKRKSKLYVQDLLENRNHLMYADYYSHEISGGTLQKLAMIMAIAKNPRLILLDEPTSGMDAWSQVMDMTILDVYKKKNQNTSIIMNTHQEILAKWWCDSLFKIPNETHS
jgi:ABC-type glutathione transport system ATPase component